MAAPITGSHPLCKQICKSLGLDPNIIHSVNINIEVGEPIQIIVGSYVDIKHMQNFAEVVQDTELIEYHEYGLTAESK